MPDIDSGYEMIRKVAEREVEKLHLLEYGKVESVNIHSSEDDGTGYTCSVLLVGRTTDDGQMLKLENVPIVTGFTGQIDVPYVDDLVLVSYINGDFELPVIVGRLYSREKKPPLFEDGQHLIEIAPSRYHPNGPEQSKIDVKFTDGSQTTINITNSSLVITSGKTKVTIQAGGDMPSIELNADDSYYRIFEDGGMLIKAKNDFEIASEGEIIIGASKDVTIQGSKINLNPP
jgi:hypothetical protein